VTVIEQKDQMSTRIVTYKDYVAGWLDTTIHDFLEILSPPSASAKYALLTCLDSNPNPAALRGKSPELKTIANKIAILGTGLILPTKLLLESDSSERIFFGFDELWFFPHKSVRPKPPTLSLVGPARLNQERLQKVAKWMEKNSCSLALGGGEGLNFVVQAHGLVRYLLGSSIEQPESALVSA
jgi:hypothetical protein